MPSQRKNSVLDTWREGQEWTEAHKAEVLRVLRKKYEDLYPLLDEFNSHLQPMVSGWKNPEDAASDETEVENGLNLNAHTQQDCAQIQRMIEALRNGSFSGKCSCGAVIPPERVVLSASFLCRECAEEKERDQKTMGTFAGSGQGGVRYA